MHYSADRGHLDVEMKRRYCALLAIALNTGILLQFIFSNFVRQLAVLVLSSNWSYLVVCYLTGGLAIYSVLVRAGISTGVRIGRILLSILLVLIALVFYLIASLDVYYSVQYLHLSFTTFVLSVIVLLFDISRPLDIVILITALYITVPIPPIVSETFMEVYPWNVVRTILGGNVRLALLVNRGLTAVSSTIAVAPLILAIYRYGKPSTGKLHVVAIPLSILSIGLVADIVRMYVYGSQHLFPELLSRILSSTITYSTILLLPVAVYYRRKLSSLILDAGESRRDLGSADFFHLFLSLLIISATTIVCIYTGVCSDGAGLRIDTSIKSMDELVPAVFNSTQLHTEITGILYADGVAVGNFTLYVDGGRYRGVVELVDTPCRLYSVERYLELNGYRVRWRWGSGDSYTINYILAEKGDINVLLAYRLLRITITTSTTRHTMYTRILLSTDGRESIESSIAVFSNILSGFREAIDAQQYLNALDVLLPLIYTSMSIVVIYISIEFLYRVYNYFREGRLRSGI